MRIVVVCFGVGVVLYSIVAKQLAKQMAKQMKEKLMWGVSLICVT